MRFHGRRVSSYFLQGLIIVVPIALTAGVLYWIFNKLDGVLRPYFGPPGVGLVVLIVGVFLVGRLTSLPFMKDVYERFDGWLERTPGVNIIYASTRDFLEAFAGKKRRFTHSVLVSIFAEDIWLVGFLTDEELSGFKLGEKKYVSVYVPQAYNIAGQLYLVKRDRLRPIEHLSSGEVMKYAMTAGALELVDGSKVAAKSRD
jgi:uncharacterized membrane protein